MASALSPVAPLPTFIFRTFDGVGAHQPHRIPPGLRAINYVVGHTSKEN